MGGKSLLTAMLCFSCSLSSWSLAQESTAQYLANEGLMVTQGEASILFDPLFRETYGQYLLMPDAMQAALFAGDPPFEDVDAVFISHHHGDHFSPEDILNLLKAQTSIHLYAPTQAVVAMRAIAAADDSTVFDRGSAVSLEYMDTPISMEMEGLFIEAVRIPHSGWPTGRTDIENISWRVTLSEGSDTTVLHMGDADPNDVHFARDEEFWNRTQVDMAFPPYWFFDSRSGPQILTERIGASRNVGIHVPVNIPSDPVRRTPSLRSADLFTQPGEMRTISP